MEAVERFNDPLAAAKHVVQEAFRTWLRYEVRTDDITIVIIFIEDFQAGTQTAVRADKNVDDDNKIDNDSMTTMFHPWPQLRSLS